MINRDLIEIFIELAREKNIERSELGTIIEQLFLFIIEKETGYVVDPNEDEVALSIHSFFNNNMYDIMTKNISNHKKNFSWEEFERTLQLYD